MKYTKARLTFTPGALPFLLKAFGHSMTENGVILNPTGEIALTPEGEELTKDNFGGFKKGSIQLLKKDLLTAIKLTEGSY
ncbi:MAG: hypothetical protein J0L54_00070 [Chitinophagales bacterium]|nr:hypothetical protein [Chitinophagales bacterium]